MVNMIGAPKGAAYYYDRLFYKVEDGIFYYYQDGDYEWCNSGVNKDPHYFNEFLQELELL